MPDIAKQTSGRDAIGQDRGPLARTEAEPATTMAPIVAAGRNCWRIVAARRAAVLVDAAGYFHYARQAMERAPSRILVIGWDFDTRVDLEPEEEGPGQTLGAFFLRLARANPARRIDVLKWSFGARKQWLKPRAAWMLLRWMRTRAIDFRFDSAHPPGCSHHQKILVLSLIHISEPTRPY